MINKKFTAIIGLGVTGLSCADFLKNRGESFVMMDDRPNPPKLEAFLSRHDPNINPIILGKFSLPLLEAASEIIISPGISLKDPRLRTFLLSGKSIIGDIELFARTIKKPVIAITGSNGKSTVTTLVGEMMAAAGLKVAVCGNIGQPVLDTAVDSTVDYYVLELSSFQLETTYSLKTKSAVVLNISEDHMDRYHNMASYIKAKQRIYNHCEYPVVNLDESFIWDSMMSEKTLISFSVDDQAANFYIDLIKGEPFIVYQNQALMKVSTLSAALRFYPKNALAALALCKTIGLSFDPLCKVLKTFPGLPHRCQWVGKFQGINYYNDSKGTNIGACKEAIINVSSITSGGLILIAGGKAKTTDFKALRPIVKKHVKYLILIGEAAQLLAETLTGTTKMILLDSLDKAVEKATNVASENDSILLSPACASFDMFDNFEKRGDAFIRVVNQYNE